MFAFRFANEMTHRHKIITTYAYCAGIFALGLIIGGVGPMISALGRQCHATLTEMKYVFPVRAIGYVIGAVLGGIIFDKYPGAGVLSLATFGIGTFQLIAGLSQSVLLLSFSFFSVGVFAGILDTGTNTLLVWVWDNDVAPYMSTMHFFFGCGAFISPLISAGVLEMTNGKVKPAILIQSAICIPVMLMFLFTKSPPPPSSDSLSYSKVEQQDKCDIDAEVAHPGSQIGETESDKFSCDEEEVSSSSSSSSKSNAAVEKVVATFISVFLALSVGTEVSYGGWISTYTMTVLSSTETIGAYVTSVYWGAFTLGRLLSIPISSRISPQQYLLLDLIIGLIGLLIILITPHGMFSICVGSSFIGLSIASMFPCCVSLPTSLGLQVSGRLTSLFVVGSSSGELLLPFLEGAAIEYFGPQSLMLCTFVVMILMSVFLVSLLSMFRKNTLVGFE